MYAEVNSTVDLHFAWHTLLNGEYDATEESWLTDVSYLYMVNYHMGVNGITYSGSKVDETENRSAGVIENNNSDTVKDTYVMKSNGSGLMEKKAS